MLGFGWEHLVCLRGALEHGGDGVSPWQRPCHGKNCLTHISPEKGHNQVPQGHGGASGLGQEAEWEPGGISGRSLYWDLPWEGRTERTVWNGLVGRMPVGLGVQGGPSSGPVPGPGRIESREVLAGCVSGR